MPDLGRDGHRERMRKSYLSGGMENAPEHNLLELFLSIIIPRKDVKPLAYDLINRFGSLENVLKASPHELMTVKGIGESTAIEISLINKMVSTVNYNKNKNIKKFTKLEDTFEFCQNLFTNEKREKVYIATLKSNLTVIDTYKVGQGSAISSSVDMKGILTYAMKDNAVYVLVTHNHPDGSAHPSGEDASFTIRLKEMLETIDVLLLDHVIVGADEVISLKHSSDYKLRL